MRKVILAAAFTLFASSAAVAQQGAAPVAMQQSAAVAQLTAPILPAELLTTRAEATAQADAAVAGEQVGNRSWWYLVAAIAVGVIIAAVVL